jgi:hypothetical protein
VIWIIIVLSVALLVTVGAYVVLSLKYSRLEKLVVFTKTAQENIDTFLALQNDLDHFGKATMEITRKDPRGYFFREPIT